MNTTCGKITFHPFFICDQKISEYIVINIYFLLHILLHYWLNWVLQETSEDASSVGGGIRRRSSHVPVYHTWQILGAIAAFFSLKYYSNL